MVSKSLEPPPSNIWVIGDIQGCHASLVQLLAKPELQTAQELWFAGDLLNRGPDSLATLRTLYSMRHRIRCVLGNHDIHILVSIAQAAHKPPTRTAQSIIEAEEAELLIDWLRHQPLIVWNPDIQTLMVHAGLLPQWSAEKAVALAQEVEVQLRSDHWKEFLGSVYGNEPDAWHDALQGVERARVIINACTRLRYCTTNGHMEFDSKEGLGTAPDGYFPWFDVAERQSASATVVFGHWSSLGLQLRPNLIGTDTGCVWGGHLTAIELGSQRIIQVTCPRYAGS